jgi:hypothetical protein
LPRAEKHSAKKFFVEGQLVGSRQRNLCRVFYFFAESFFVCSQQRSLFAESFSLPGVIEFALCKTFFAESFLFGFQLRIGL